MKLSSSPSGLQQSPRARAWLCRPTSLQGRITRAFAVFGAAMCACYAVTVSSAFYWTEDLVQRRQLEIELEHLLARGHSLDQEVIPVSRFMTAYIGNEALPRALLRRVRNLEPGIHEFGDTHLGLHKLGFGLDLELQVAIAELEGRAERLYLVFDVDELESTHRHFHTLSIALSVSFALLAVAGVVIGKRLAARVTAPITALAATVRRQPPDQLDRAIEAQVYDEEIEVLVQALRDAATRIRGFIERERQFTANASHELRTPVTVIKGAAELLEACSGPDQPELSRPVARILRATSSMEQIIEVFLTLAREESLGTPMECISLCDVVEEMVRLHRPLLGDRPVSVSIQVSEEIEIEAPRRALAIVIGNLISNAFARTESGAVSITWRGDRLEIKDTGPGIPSGLLERATRRGIRDEPKQAEPAAERRLEGHGLGLSIVASLCERCGWSLRLESAESIGTRATLVLRSSAPGSFTILSPSCDIRLTAHQPSSRRAGHRPVNGAQPGGHE